MTHEIDLQSSSDCGERLAGTAVTGGRAVGSHGGDGPSAQADIRPGGEVSPLHVAEFGERGVRDGGVLRYGRKSRDVRSTPHDRDLAGVIREDARLVIQPTVADTSPNRRAFGPRRVLQPFQQASLVPSLSKPPPARCRPSPGGRSRPHDVRHPKASHHPG